MLNIVIYLYFYTHLTYIFIIFALENATVAQQMRILAYKDTIIF